MAKGPCSPPCLEEAHLSESTLQGRMVVCPWLISQRPCKVCGLSVVEPDSAGEATESQKRIRPSAKSPGIGTTELQLDSRSPGRVNKGEMGKRKKKGARERNGTSFSELLKSTCKGRLCFSFPLCSTQRETERERGKIT